jgi:glutathione S-transferase
MTMKLYGGIASPYVARVAMLAKLKGLDIECLDAPGGLKSPEFLAISPLGKIPAFEVDGKTLVESEVISEYLEDAFPETPMMPADPMARAHSRIISRMTDLYIAPHNSGLFGMRDPAKRDQAVVDKAAAEFKKGFAAIEEYLVGPFCAGDKPGLADCALAPFIIMLKTNTFANFSEIADPTEGDGKLAQWWKNILNDPACSAFIDEYQIAFDKFMIFLKEMMARRQG